MLPRENPTHVRPSICTDVRVDFPSLRDRPCEYPDARPNEQRWPYVYMNSRIYPLELNFTAPVHLMNVSVRTENGSKILSAWLRSHGLVPIEKRLPVLACGSNAYPRQLADKFLRFPVADDSILTLPSRIHGIRIVYAASFSVTNGYIPVTPQHVPDGEAETWIQWLSPEQIEAISETEGRGYRLVELTGVDLVIPGLRESPTRIYAWWHDSFLDLGAGAIDHRSQELSTASTMTEADVLHDTVGLFIQMHGLETDGASLTWDGCVVPTSLREPLRDFIAEHGYVNPIARTWSVIDRSKSHFADNLLPT